MSQQRQLPYSVILLILGFTFIIYLVSPTTLLNLFYGEFDPYLSADRKVVVYEKMIEALRNMDKYCKDRRFYCKRPETRHVDCRRVLRGDKAYLQSLTGINRIPLIENPFLNLTCSAIKNRIIPKSSQFKLLMLNGTAFARIVFADYEFIEKQVQASYHPQNFFCFAVDANSSAEFQKRMKALERCLPNVFVLPVTESYDSKGHNINLAHYNCMKRLEASRGWGYLMLLQNHDVITKSVYELDRIFDLLAGANDVFMSKEIPGRRNKHSKWDLKSLRLFRNESRNSDYELEISSGFVQASLSRAVVEWLVNEVDVSILLQQLNMTMLPAFDFSIIECTAELLHNRTYLGQRDYNLEDDIYKNLVSVQYHENHKKSDYKLNCTSNFKPWNYLDYL